MVGDLDAGQLGEEADRPVEGAGRGLGALGGVLGDVRRYGPLGQLVAAVEGGGADRTDVELTAEDEGVRPRADGRAVDACGGGSGVDRVPQQLGRGPGRGRGVATLGTVETDDRVEVDGAALLVLGHLGKGDAGVVAEGPLRETGELGDLTAEVDGEAPPQGPGVRVPEHGLFVVVCVRVEGCTENRVCFVVPNTAATRPPVGGAVVDRAEARRGEGGEDARVRADLLRGALATAETCGDQVVGVAAIDLRTGTAPGGTAVVAADEKAPGGEGGRVEVQDAPDLTGRRVDGVLGTVAVQAYRVRAAAQAGELTGQFGQGAE